MEIKDLECYSFGKEAEKRRLESISRAAPNRPGFVQKNLACFVDFIIVLVIRLITALILTLLWYKFKMKEVLVNNTINESHIMDFILKFGIIYDVFSLTLIAVFVGGMYYIVSFSLKSASTVGCFLFDMKLVDRKTGNHVSFIKSLIRYILFTFPVFFLVILIWKFYKGDFDILFIILFILTVVWYDLSIITRSRQSIPDIICNTGFISTRIKKRSIFKFPFFKFGK